MSQGEVALKSVGNKSRALSNIPQHSNKKSSSIRWFHKRFKAKRRVKLCVGSISQEEVGELRKVLTFVIVLLALSIVTPGIVHAIATRAEFTGFLSMTATWPGDIYVLKSGIMRQVGALASGPVESSDDRLNGVISIVLNAIFNLNTGEGVAFGSFTITNAGGTFEGMFRVKDTNYVLFEGAIEGHGTGGYKGLLLKLEMMGTDLYRDADPATNGISADFVGYIISVHGA